MITVALSKEIQQSTPFDSDELETYLNIQRTAGILAGPVDRWFKHHQLSQPLYNMLRILRGHTGDGLACSHIGERMVTRVPDITRLVDKLIGMGLARRERSIADRRVVLISITERGLSTLTEMEKPTENLIREALGHLSAHELKDLNRLLVKARKRDKGDH